MAEIRWPKVMPKKGKTPVPELGAQKKCRACDTFKPLDKFPRCSLKLVGGGLVFVCLDCIKAHLPEHRKPKRTPRKKVSTKCSRATFEGMIEGYPSLEGMAALAWECWRRLSAQRQIKAMEAMNDTEGDDPTDWIMAKINASTQRKRRKR